MVRPPIDRKKYTVCAFAKHRFEHAPFQYIQVTNIRTKFRPPKLKTNDDLYLLRFKRSKYRASFVLSFGQPKPQTNDVLYLLRLKRSKYRSSFVLSLGAGIWYIGYLYMCNGAGKAKDKSLHRPRREYVCCAFVMARSQCCQMRLLVRARCCLASPSVAIDHPSSSCRADFCAQFEEAQALRPCRRKRAGRNRCASIRSREGS